MKDVVINLYPNNDVVLIDELIGALVKAKEEKGFNYIEVKALDEAKKATSTKFIAVLTGFKFNSDKFDYYSPEFRKLRHEVFLRDGEVCAKCGATPSLLVSLTIDHIKPISKFPDLALDINNLQVLCWPCNKEKSNKHFTDYRREVA